MEPYPHDLFGEVPVTRAELDQWCRVVGGFDPSSWRAAWYAENYRVADKIRAAKVAGTLPEILEAATPAAPRDNQGDDARPGRYVGAPRARDPDTEAAISLRPTRRRKSPLR